MTKINIVIINIDLIYLNKLKAYIIKEYNDKFNLHCISDLSLVEEELESFKKGVLLINEELYKSEFKNLNFDEIIILSDGIGRGEIDGNKVLNKYSSTSKLCEDIICIHNNKIRYEGEVKKEDTKVSIVFSPIGKAGSSSISSNIAILLSKLGKKVLYVNLEKLKTTEWFFKSRQYGDILFRENENLKFMPKLQKGIMKDEITGTYYFDYEIEGEESFVEFRQILNFIVKEKIFSLIVVDMDSNIDIFNRRVLNLGESILVPVLGDDMSLFKMKKYLDKYTISKKTAFILNKYKRRMEVEKIESGELDIKGYINFDSDIENAKYQNLYESKSFIYDIDKIIKNILKVYN